MFRAAKLLYLLAIVAIVAVLAVVDQFAPALHMRSLRNHLRVETSTARALLETRQALRTARAVDWAEQVARSEAVRDASLRLAASWAAEESDRGPTAGGDAGEPEQASDGAPAAGGGAVADGDGGLAAEGDDGAVEADDEAAEEGDGALTLPSLAAARELERDVAESAERASRDVGWRPQVVAFARPDGELAVVADPSGLLPAGDVVRGVDNARTQRSGRAGFQRCGPTVCLAAYAPVLSAGGEVVGVVIAGEQLRAERYDGFRVGGADAGDGSESTDQVGVGQGHRASGLLFVRTDGSLISTNLQEGPALHAAERLLAATGVGSDEGARAAAAAGVRLDEDDGRVLALTSGWFWRRDTWEENLGYVLVIDGGEAPSSLAGMLLGQLEHLPGSSRLWLIVGVAAFLFVLGVVLFEFEGVKYRQTIAFLEYQLSRPHLGGEAEETPEDSRAQDAAGGDGEVADTVEADLAEGAAEGPTDRVLTDLARERDGDGGDGRLADHRAVFREYLRARADTGESTQASFERFSRLLEEKERQVRLQYRCDAVRFRVKTVEGKAVVVAVPRLSRQ